MTREKEAETPPIISPGFRGRRRDDAPSDPGAVVVGR